MPGACNRSKHRGRLPRLQSMQHRSRRPVLWAPATAPLPSGAETRDVSAGDDRSIDGRSFWLGKRVQGKPPGSLSPGRSPGSRLIAWLAFPPYGSGCLSLAPRLQCRAARRTHTGFPFSAVCSGTWTFLCRTRPSNSAFGYCRRRRVGTSLGLSDILCTLSGFP